MGKKSSFSFFGMFKSKASKKVWNGEADYPRDDMVVNAYKTWRSDEDRGTMWVAEPGIDSKATLFINGKTNKKVWNGEDYPREEMVVNAYKTWRSDEDRGTMWVAEPGIDSKATLFINGKTKFWSNSDS
nr:hypothetical protein CQW23_20297 [Ipomoea batatas]